MEFFTGTYTIQIWWAWTLGIMAVGFGWLAIRQSFSARTFRRISKIYKDSRDEYTIMYRDLGRRLSNLEIQIEPVRGVDETYPVALDRIIRERETQAAEIRELRVALEGANRTSRESETRLVDAQNKIRRMTSRPRVKGAFVKAKKVKP